MNAMAAGHRSSMKVGSAQLTLLESLEPEGERERERERESDSDRACISQGPLQCDAGEAEGQQAQYISVLQVLDHVAASTS